MKQILIPLLLIFTWACYNIKTEEESLPELQEQIIFPLQGDHVHGPTVVELPNGDILSAWFQGSGERWADDVQIMGARLSKGDTNWSAPFLMADNPGFPDINPMMFMDNQDRLWLMWYAVLANLWETSLPMYRQSENYDQPGAPLWDWQEVILAKPGDKTERGIQPNDRFVLGAQKQLEEYEVYLNEEIFPKISEELKAEYIKGWEKYKSKIDSLAKGENMLRKGRAMQDGEKGVVLGYPLSRRIGWQTKNKPLIVGERLIVPFYSDGLDCSIFAISDDWGKTWEYSNPVLGGAGIQAAMAIKKDGTLVAYLRDNGPPPQRIQLTESKDNGLSWSIPKDTDLPNSGAGFDMVTLANGDWLMVYNDSEEHRHNVVAAISDDDGKTWKWKKFLENDLRKEKATRSHYPAVIQGKDGRIHAIYSHHHNDREGANKTVKYASFSIDWVKGGS
ncbi:MAG: exo-alpha-sialidase [Flammeovirgaceae bacterium]|nr:exo-alpha-sialidase [Flammeovirgaceae bacterium]